ncbi:MULTISPECIES: bifunctional DNA primase/polymerase [unclassified Microbacterium]|uniref:bifunctional DNA primase/polymerase n=1 Tax=unclassified Microbacterium TaxID=2609290 RepID=UPI000EA84A96|nr:MULTISPECIES: bifunctional DNA primase/polymerase [unclassified Microbacterium]MBT2486618.1 bifunctional DNA primase/polymerase [Microbacterium sp. ISL-108]RKN69302.1 DNA primase [Microbacterium sp. CGR2]
MTITDPSTWPMPAHLHGGLAHAAATYAAAGILVFPCAPGQKRPLTEHGFRDASTDLVQIDAWWGRHPDANIGIPTGTVVNVLDVDVHATGTGYPILRTLHREGLIGGWGQAVRSPSGGLHLYYPTDSDRQVGSWSRGRAHVDFRGTGGYIIAPPSGITAGHGNRRYEIIARGRGPRPVDADAIRELLTPQREQTLRPLNPVILRERAVEKLVGWVATLPEGNRNAGLFWAACRLAEAGLAEPDTFGVLKPAASAAGLEAREIAATIRSAHRATRITEVPDDPVADEVRFFSGIGR